MKAILVTGCAGFIGSNLVDSLLDKGCYVVGLDNFDDYYNPQVKRRNLKSALKNKRFKLFEVDILEIKKVQKIFNHENIEKVVHLAARPGVRPSIKDPIFYAKNNIEGTVNLLDLSCKFNVSKFIFASSSSVYGQSEKIPFNEEDQINSLSSPYGASKRSGEFFVESFHKNYGMNAVIFRFFTVYGERGRPDMAPALFSEAVLRGKVIKQFGNGDSYRDYTYIEDVIDAILLALENNLKFAIINLGNNNPVRLDNFIKNIELISHKKANIKRLPKQLGDVDKTWADIVKAKLLLGWSPKTKLNEGLKKYIKWLKEN